MAKCLVCVDVYTVKAGDTLYSIAQNYDIPVSLLMKVNQIRNPYNMKIGTKLCIPGGAENLPENRPPMRPGNNMPGNNMPGGNMPAAPGEGTMPLPTPSVPPMRPEHNMPGNNMPGGNMPAAPGEGTMPLPTPSVPPQQPTCRGTMHTIAAGDTLYMIAKKYRVNLDAIINANPGIDPYNLRIGMKICIPR